MKNNYIRQKLSTEEFIARAIKKHGDKYDYSKTKYENYVSKVIIICKKCHTQFETTPSNHILKTGCPTCGIIKQRVTTEEFIKMAREIHGDKYDYSKTKYITAKIKVKIVCKKCNTVFKQLPRGHIYEESGCPKCRLSHGESKISRILDLLNIDFIPQHKFPNCRGPKGKPLPFDFFIASLNVCIEYDGKQHSDKNSKFYSLELLENDKTKDAYCKENGIKMIRIPYTKFKVLDVVLRQWLF